MLYIKHNPKGKAIFAFQPKNDNLQQESNNENITPSIPNMLHSKHKFCYWLADNITHANDIINLYVDALQQFVIVNPQYVCSVNNKNLRSNLLHVIYKCSHNSNKDYPSLTSLFM